MSAAALLSDAEILARWTPPARLPKGWRQVSQGIDGYKYIGPGGLSVIASVCDHDDGKVWLHVSIGHRTRLPLWSELTWLKETFVGPDAYAIQIFPPKSKYVNLNPHVLHLWSCLDGHPLPEFSGMIAPGVRSI